ncbi:MAG: DUF4232 domain-containing protein [Acidimicrobiales bacterium]
MRAHLRKTVMAIVGVAVVVGLGVTIATSRGAPSGKVRLATRSGSGLPARTCPTAVPVYPGKPPPTPPCPSFTPPPTLRASVQCTKADLRLSSTWRSAWHGDAGESIVLINTSSQPCYLPGPPPLKLALSSGATEAVSSAGPLASTRVDVAPGAQLFIGVGSPAVCPPGVAPLPSSALTLTLPGGSLTVPGWTVCGQPVLQNFLAPWYTMAPPVVQTIPPGTPPPPSATH